MGKTIDFFAEDNKYRQSPQFPVKQKVTDGVMFYHCKRHDYMYYPEPVTNEEGVRYRAGYYDETGKYYKELKLYHTFPEGGILCKYCGHCVTEDELEGMESLKCPNCDASFELVTPADVVKKDKVITSEVRFTDKSEAEAKRYVHMPDQRVVPTSDVSRPRAAYDPNYDADSGTDFDKEYNLDEKYYERLSFGAGRKEEDRPIQRDESDMAATMVIATIIAFIFLFMGIISFFGPMN